MGNRSVVLCQQGEEDCRWAGGEVVQEVWAKGAQEEEDEGWEEGGVREGGQKEGLGERWGVSLTFSYVLILRWTEWLWVMWCMINGKTYPKLPTPPQPLHNPHIVKPHARKQDLRTIQIRGLPYQKAPVLAVVQYVRADGEGEVGFRVC